MTLTVVIGCGAAKLTDPTPARDLYTGQLFVSSRRAVEHTGRPWLILSALYGFLSPDQIIKPYDKVLSGSVKDRERLASLLKLQRSKWPRGPVESWCSWRYTDAMRRAGVPVALAPLDGLSLGYRNRWFKERMEE